MQPYCHTVFHMFAYSQIILLDLCDSLNKETEIVFLCKSSAWTELQHVSVQLAIFFFLFVSPLLTDSIFTIHHW